MRQQACERLLKFCNKQTFSFRQLGNFSGLAKEDLPAQAGASHHFCTSPGSATSPLLPPVPHVKDLRSACALPHARAFGGDQSVQAHTHIITDCAQHFRSWGAPAASSRGHAEPLRPSTCSAQPHVITAMYLGHPPHPGNDIVTNRDVQPCVRTTPHLSSTLRGLPRPAMRVPCPPSTEGGPQTAGGQVLGGHLGDVGMVPEELGWRGGHLPSLWGWRGGVSPSLWEESRSGPLHRESLWQEEGGVQPLYADSVRRKRKHKMNKHKHRKRRKKLRHQK